VPRRAPGPGRRLHRRPEVLEVCTKAAGAGRGDAERVLRGAEQFHLKVVPAPKCQIYMLSTYK
jgi:hypothetical protein